MYTELLHIFCMVTSLMFGGELYRTLSVGYDGSGELCVPLSGGVQSCVVCVCVCVCVCVNYRSSQYTNKQTFFTKAQLVYCMQKRTHWIEVSASSFDQDNTHNNSIL